jgi:hypothetical protein
LVVCLVGLLVVVFLGTRLTFFNDDWYFLLQRPGLESHGGLDTLLAPHNSQSVVLTALAYKVLVALFGLSSQLPFRLVLGLAVAAVGVFVYLLVSARAGPAIGLACAAVILFMGSAWEDLLFFASLDLVGSLATGLGAIWALRRDSVGRNVAACVLLLCSVGFSNVGVPFVVSGAVAILLRRRASQLWIVVAPAALFAVWWAVYGSTQPSHLSGSNLAHLPRYVVESASFGLASATGLYRGAESAVLQRGHVLLVVAAALVVICLVRGWRPRATALVPASALVAFWFLTGASYFSGREPSASRYQLIDAALLIVVAAELYRPGRWHRPVTVVVVIAAAAVVASNIDGGLSYGYRFLRDQSGFVKADLAALEAAPRPVPAGLRLVTPIGENPYLSGISAGRLFAETAAHGPIPNYSLAQLRAAAASQREAADSVLVFAERIAPGRPADRARVRSGCARLAGAGEQIVRPGTWQLSNPGRAILLVGLRRFGPPGQPRYVALLGPRRATRVTIPRDRLPLPWFISVRARGRVPLEICPS